MALVFFIEKWHLINYADDNTLIACDINFDLITFALQIDALNAINWFTVNYMKVNPEKFQIMFVKPFHNQQELPNFIVYTGYHHRK